MIEAWWPGRIALVVLLVASMSGFWWRFRRVLGIIRGARRTSDFAVSPLGPRILQWLWEVGLQGKVIAQRPLPGLAHALVFWGFCAFALITVNHLASAFGAGFLSRAGGFGQLYFGFVAVWAVAVGVAIVGLFVRRFFVRPVWLGPLSLESGVIALLILALMITYLAGLWFVEGGLGARWSWWLHTLTLLIRRAGFSRIPPLVGDEDFGLIAGKDVTRIDVLQAYSCVECGRCTE